jgi:hypothetical protein
MLQWRNENAGGPHQQGPYEARSQQRNGWRRRWQEGEGEGQRQGKQAGQIVLKIIMLKFNMMPATTETDKNEANKAFVKMAR